LFFVYTAFTGTGEIAQLISALETFGVGDVVAAVAFVF
jgi:hypothetical protein